MAHKFIRNIDDELDAEIISAWLPQSQADAYFKRLLKCAWQIEELRLFGKWITVPRKILWVGDINAEYSYSGKTHKPIPWHEPFIAIRNQLTNIAPFNSVLANYYKGGDDYMGWHSDDEPELGEQAIIASLSLGAERRFLFRHKRGKRKVAIVLKHGSLLLMYGNCQRQWQHSLPKMRKIQDARINLTFRYLNL